MPSLSPIAGMLSGLLLMAAQASAQEVPQPPEEAPCHPFWDRTNSSLFVGVAGSRALDFASTRSFRARGLNEILLTNDIVDNKPLFLGIELAGAAASIGVSALLHRHGHHRLERWVSILHIGITSFGAVRNYALRGPSPSRAAGS